eukprot:23680-Eustigmatos_ZCMA.PRE.1
MLIIRPSILHDDPGVEPGFAMFRHVYDFSRDQAKAVGEQRPFYGHITGAEKRSKRSSDATRLAIWCRKVDNLAASTR